MMHWLSAMHHDDECTFTTQKVHEQLEEGINRESLEREQLKM